MAMFGIKCNYSFLEIDMLLSLRLFIFEPTFFEQPIKRVNVYV